MTTIFEFRSCFLPVAADLADGDVAEVALAASTLLLSRALAEAAEAVVVREAYEHWEEHGDSPGIRPTTSTRLVAKSDGTVERWTTVETPTEILAETVIREVRVDR